MKGNNIKTNIIKDKIFFNGVVVLSIISIIPLALILYYIMVKGLPVINHWFFILKTNGSAMGGDKFMVLEGLERIKSIGGIANAVVGTFLIVGLGSLVSIPFGVTVGIYLSENKDKKFAGIVQVAVDMIQGIPSIIFGIIMSLWLVRTMKVFSFAGSFALALMMLPIVIKNTEETLKLVPLSVKEAALALGTPYRRMVMKVILPSGLSGIITGILVGVARIMGETAPLIFTAFSSHFIRWDLTEKMYTLPTLIYRESMSPYPNWILNSWGASCALVIFILVLNLITKMVVNKWKIKY